MIRRILFLFFPLSFLLFSAEPPFELTDTMSLQIGNKIWKNECNGTLEGLTSWNSGENFASLGINHFIWYPAEEKKVFDESFPKLILFLRDHQVLIPQWLQTAAACPWNNREEFLNALKNPQEQRITELKSLLQNTIALQARFSILRLKNALPLILEKTDLNNQPLITTRFNLLAKTPSGLFALIDYVNFKGEGIKESERYHHQGWGLLQVLEEMRETESNAALAQFSQAAAIVLTRRVKNSPPERKENRWLPGWINRTKSYLH